MHIYMLGGGVKPISKPAGEEKRSEIRHSAPLSDTHLYGSLFRSSAQQETTLDLVLCSLSP